jgi:tetratricopeptide (TPR) repeat protein
MTGTRADRPMSNATLANEQISRMREEAELYEAQGLYSHSMEIYRSILKQDPRDQHARKKLRDLLTSQGARAEDDTLTTRLDDLTPRLALDLGLAYMGMNLYEEALNEFKKGLKASPALKNELLQQMAVSLTHLQRVDEAQKCLQRIFADRTLTYAEQGAIISDMADIYLEHGFVAEAHDLLVEVPEETKGHIRDYEAAIREIKHLRQYTDVEVIVEDEETGELYGAEEIIQLPDEPRPETARAGTGAAQRKAASQVRPQPGETARRPAAKTALEAGHAEALDEKQPAELFDDEIPDAVRFACLCGHVYSTPRASVGASADCRECGRNLIVPDTDKRKDGLTEKVLGKVVGGCRVLHKLGGGGMGGVFRAHHIGLDIDVAVKVLHAHLAEREPVFIKRFIREARATAKLQHPNIVGVMNVGYENGLHFLVMPYVGGGSAAALLNKIGRLPVGQVLHVAVQIVLALQVAEENNIMHRDIKPANILFTERGDVKLADLGLAKSYMDSQDNAITQTGIACGTPLYFSPEQAKGSQELDIRSDIYSLGITMYHLMEGHPPFMAESAYVIFQKHVHEPLPPFQEATPPVPDNVFRLLKKMTAKKPENRYPNTQELLDAMIPLRDELLSSDTRPARKSLLERLGIMRGI